MCQSCSRFGRIDRNSGDIYDHRTLDISVAEMKFSGRISCVINGDKINV